MLSLLLMLVGGGCASAPSFDSSLSSIVKPYLFSIVGWEFKTIPAELNRVLFGKTEKICQTGSTYEGVYADAGHPYQ